MSKYFVLKCLVIIGFWGFPSIIFGQNGLDIIEGPIHIISCDSTCTMLHANFPKPLKTNQYVISSIPYSPLTNPGTAVNLLDDKFSSAIPIGFNFCFFENVFTQCYLADNGVLTFNSAYNNGSCNNNTQQVLPYFNSTFPDNAIFFNFMDIAPTLGGSIKYTTIGLAPFRKFVVNYQNVRLFGLTCSSNTSSFQVVLNESTNMIDIHVTNKIGCDNNTSNYANYGTIGIQDAGATTAFTAAGKHASIFTMSNESIRIAPSGSPNYLLKWRDAYNNVIATNVDSIYFCPTTIPYNKVRAEINFYCPAATFKDSVIIDKDLPDITSILILPPLCNGDSAGIITVSATGSNPPFTYAINGGSFSSNHVFTMITNGFYYLSVKDANGCRIDSLIQVFPQYNVAVIVDSIIRPICPDSNGKIYIHPANGLPPYTISWSNGMSGSPITGLTQGVYIVTITDANGCTTNASIVLPFDSIPELIYSITKPICHDSSGAIYLSISSGTQPYHYQWNTGDTIQNLTNLMAGQYSVIVTDINGCSVNSIISLPDTLAVETIDTVIQHTTCGLNNGIATVYASMGIPPYTYLWMPSGQITVTAIGLAPGIYTITTTDVSNCSEIDTLTILPSLAIINSVSKANANCDSSNGKIYLNNVSNWTGWVDTLWSTGSISSVVTGLAPGNYWVKTTDSLGCVKTDTITLANDGKPYLGLVSYTQPLCYGDSTGSITLTGSSGTSPYKYSIDGINFTSIAQINNIAGGTYTIYITDANSCPHDTIVFFNQPSQILSSYTTDTIICFNNETATIQISTIGGHPPYLFAFNGGSFISQWIYTHLKQGNYPFIVKDSNGCEVVFNATVPGPDSALQVIKNIKDVPCFETNTGYAKLSLVGGWPPYQYTWSNGNIGLEMNQASETHTSITVKDNMGCEISEPIDIEQLLCCKAIVPNAFSPNNDSKNDILRVLPISEIESVKFSIYDRWGKQIFSTNNLNESWDGKFHGIDCDLDVYFYYLEYSCPFQKEKVIQKGDITLIR